MASSLVTPPVVKARALNCPSCGAAVELRGFGYTLTVVCPNCKAMLDASSPEIKILGQIQEAQIHDLKIPLGTRGKLHGVEWETIGFQTRDVVGESDCWDEYLLFNPYKGFRYLTEYQGHWNFVTPLETIPARLALPGRMAVKFEGATFRLFSGCEAMTSFVLGEFPWRVQVGERVACDDFIAPPLVLSSETTADEVTWSRGEYTAAGEIWKAFALPGKPAAPRGVYLNQPSPYRGGMWGSFFLMMLLLIVLAMFFSAFSSGKTAFYKSYHFSTQTGGEASFVTPVFPIDGRIAGTELMVRTDLVNNWAYFNFALINDDTGSAYDFGREVSYYHGTDSDGAWTEGSSDSTAYIPSVPPGRYYLRVEPEMDGPSGPYGSPGKRFNAMAYDITIRHDVPNYAWFWIAGLLLLIPPAFTSIRRRSFEAQRWNQSGPASGAMTWANAAGRIAVHMGD